MPVAPKRIPSTGPAVNEFLFHPLGRFGLQPNRLPQREFGSYVEKYVFLCSNFEKDQDKVIVNFKERRETKKGIAPPAATPFLRDFVLGGSILSDTLNDCYIHLYEIFNLDLPSR